MHDAPAAAERAVLSTDDAVGSAAPTSPSNGAGTAAASSSDRVSREDLLASILPGDNGALQKDGSTLFPTATAGVYVLVKTDGRVSRVKKQKKSKSKSEIGGVGAGGETPPPPWTRVTDGDDVYYFNTVTGESAWTLDHVRAADAVTSRAAAPVASVVRPIGTAADGVNDAPIVSLAHGLGVLSPAVPLVETASPPVKVSPARETTAPPAATSPADRVSREELLASILPGDEGALQKDGSMLYPTATEGVFVLVKTDGRVSRVKKERKKRGSKRAVPEVPPPWTRVTDGDDEFFYNTETQESVWTLELVLRAEEGRVGAV